MEGMRLRHLLLLGASLLVAAAANTTTDDPAATVHSTVSVASPSQCPSSSTSPLHIPNNAGVQVFAHSEDGYNCTRIPTVIRADGVLLAIAEGRKWVGDGCLPHGSTMGAPQSASRRPARPAAGILLAPDQPYTDVVLKRSTVRAPPLRGLPPPARVHPTPHSLSRSLTRDRAVLAHASPARATGRPVARLGTPVR